MAQRTKKRDPQRAAKNAKQVENLRHGDKRRNIPTNELRGFMEDQEKWPETMLYPRDPSLDPQLVWRGKDQQDSQDLEVPVVPVYIQEKIHPRAIIESIRAEQRSAAEPQADLFADFNGLPFEDLIEFYQHEQNWSNRLILGDSLLVMNSLAEKEGLKGKVQMIYMDPPYGIKFGSNWQVSTRKRDVTDGKIEDASREPEVIKAFRDTWELGIHSYLTYLRDRMTVARDLLSDRGCIFVQIGDDNVHLVRSVLDEVFGSDNFISLIPFKKTTGSTGDFLPGTTDFLIFFSKDRASFKDKYRPLYHFKEMGEVGGTAYRRIELQSGIRRSVAAGEIASPSTIPFGSRVFRLDNLTSQSMGRQKGEGAASWFPVAFKGLSFRPSLQARWKTNESGMERLAIIANENPDSGVF